MNYTSELTVNNDFVTNHTGGYTSFIQPVPTNAVQGDKDNVLRVVVSNTLDFRRSIPLRPWPWDPRNYGGVVRGLSLIGTPKIYVKDIAIKNELVEKGTAANIVVLVTVDAKEPLMSETPDASEVPGSYGFYYEILDKISGIMVGRSVFVPMSASESGVWSSKGEVTVPSPKLWSPDTPELYLMRCYLVKGTVKENTVVDELDLSTGIRTLGVENGHIQVNGKRIVLKGVVWNEDSPSGGNALTEEQMEKDVALIRNLGANVIRFINHPPDPYMLDLCDRYGLLAMEEIPLAHPPGLVLADEGYVDLAGSMLREMILRDKNHPSVLAWGLGDELESTHPATRSALERLVSLSHSLDGRPTYYGASLLHNDISSTLVDIAALNLPSNDLRDWRAGLEEWRASHRAQPVIVSKFGTEVQHDNRRGTNDPLSQEAQARFYLQRFDILRSLDYDGGIIWAFNDWRGDRPSLTVMSGDPWIHTLGLVNAAREKRLAYEAVRSIFHGEKFVALPIGGRPSGAPIIYVLAGFAALVGVAYVYNVSRRFREKFNRSLLSSYNFYSDVRDQHTVPFMLTTLLGLVVSLGTAITVSSILFHFRDNIYLDNLLSIVLVSDTIKAEVVVVIWNPLKAIGFLTAAVFVGLVVISVAVYVIRLFFKQRIYSTHAYAVTMWSAAPLVVFIIVGMILYRILESQAYVMPALILVAAIHLWVYLRLLKGMSIVYDVLPLKMYAAGIVAMICVFGVVYVYFDATASAPMYISYMYHMMTNSF
jgi:beta-glucuronidase